MTGDALLLPGPGDCTLVQISTCPVNRQLGKRFLGRRRGNTDSFRFILWFGLDGFGGVSFNHCIRLFFRLTDSNR